MALDLTTGRELAMSLQEETLNFDPDALAKKYALERDKRVRADGNDQYQEVVGEFAYFVEDPYISEALKRDSMDDEVEVVIIGGGFGVESGLIGNLYGVDVYVSSNCPVIETAAENGASSLDTRGCLFFHKDALVMAEQMAVRSQTQYKQEYLSTLYTADTLYGVETYRPEAGFILSVADE